MKANVQSHNEWARIWCFKLYDWINRMEIFWFDLWLFPDDAIANTMSRFVDINTYMYIYNVSIFNLHEATIGCLHKHKQLIKIKQTTSNHLYLRLLFEQTNNKQNTCFAWQSLPYNVFQQNAFDICGDAVIHYSVQ